MSDPRHRRGRVHIPHWILHASHFVATAVALVVVVLAAFEQRFNWLQHSPGGDAFDLNEQPIFMVLFAIGALLALRWQLLGGALSTFTACGLIVFATHQLRLFDAVVVTVGFLVPSLLWMMVGLFELRDEQFHRAPDEHPRPLLRRRDVLAGLGVTAIAAVGGLRIGSWLFDRIYGPTHPASQARAVQGSATRWIWSGAVTDTTAAVTTRLEDDESKIVQLLVGEDPTLSDARDIPGISDQEGVVRIDVDELESDTRYHYTFVVEGARDDARVGTFITQPLGPASFSVAVASCARTGSNGAVFDAIRSAEPRMMINAGDLHYADIALNDQQAFRQILDHTLSRPGQAALFQACPVAWVWDDHDFGGADASTNSRPAAMATYRQFVPHYPLASAESALYQAFSIGRVRFLLTDVRSARVPGDDADAGTMLGADQKAWLKRELLHARDTSALTVWVNPVPWIANVVEEGDDDHWGAFAAERREIAEFIADNGIASSLLMVSGDAHMLAIDDGTNSDFSSSRAGGFPVLHAAALDRPGSVKGGPYSHGSFPGGGQFGLIAVDDDGMNLDVSLTGRDWRNQVLVEHSFRVITDQMQS